MVECLTFGTFLVVMSCLSLVITEGMQNADAASFKPEILCEMHQQHKLQQLQQQQLGSRYSHLAADSHALLVDSPRYPVFRSDKSLDLSLDLASSLGVHAQGASSLREGERLRLRKRETTAPYLTSDEQVEPSFVMDAYSPIDDETILMRSSAPGSSPYLSAREFKETFRRSNPYFLGKRDRYDLLADDKMLQAGDKRGAPIFVGKRDSSVSVEAAGNSILPGNYLVDFVSKDKVDSLIEDKTRHDGSANKYPHKSIRLIAKVFESESDMGQTSGQKRAAPKFVGRRKAPSFVGKRGPLKFFGKRLTNVGDLDDNLVGFEDKRGSPKFVGKRGSLYFSDKRAAPRFIGKRVKEWDESSLPEDKRRAPKFVGRGAAPYFVGKRDKKNFFGKFVTSHELKELNSPAVEDLSATSTVSEDKFNDEQEEHKFVQTSN